MKRILASTIMIGALAATPAFAIPDDGLVRVNRNEGYFAGNGGEFTVTAVSGAFKFQTFCLEGNESVGGNPHYYELNVGDAAVMGGVSGGNPDPISIGTAFLYDQFIKGTLAGYDYTPGAGREASAEALQTVIWHLEGELTYGGGNDAADALLALLGGFDDPMADNNGAYKVKVMNMYNTDQAGALVHRQDFLAPVPDGGLTAALLGMGLLGLGWFNRRVRS